MQKLNEDLMEISNIMQQNIADILEQGERLDHMSEMSSYLSSESKRYASNARSLSRQALIRKYAPYAALVLFLLCVYLIRRFLRCDCLDCIGMQLITTCMPTRTYSRRVHTKHICQKQVCLIWVSQLLLPLLLWQVPIPSTMTIPSVAMCMWTRIC